MNVEQYITHVACSDESNWNIGRFRSIALISCPAEYLPTLVDEVNTLLSKSDVKEFRWKKLRTARERFAAIGLIDFALKYACSGCLRVDVIVWDIEDSRHKISRRDDIKNLQRMYYHLFKNVLRERWPDNSVWMLFPDEHTALDWESAKDFLGYADSTTEVVRDIFTGGTFKLRLRKEFYIHDIKETSSGAPSIIQLAELFAGMASFSRGSFEKYLIWEKANAGQLSFLDDSKKPKLSNAEKERFAVLHHLNCCCKNNKMGVSLKTHRGLRTLDPKNPINFWWYEPQSEMDKAPTRKT